MNAIQLVRYKHFNDAIEDQNTVVSEKEDLSEANHPLLIAYWQHLREIKSIHNKTDDFKKNASMLHQVSYLCQHNLLFFLMLTGQYNAIHDLFKPKNKLGRAKSLIHKIKKRRRRHVAANQKKFTFVPVLIQTTKELEQHIKCANIEALYERDLKALSALSQKNQGTIRANRYNFFKSNLDACNVFSELNLPIYSIEF